MRLLAGYLTFIVLRLVLTVIVGWVAIDYMSREYETVADAVDLIARSIGR